MYRRRTWLSSLVSRNGAWPRGVRWQMTILLKPNVAAQYACDISLLDCIRRGIARFDSMTDEVVNVVKVFCSMVIVESTQAGASGGFCPKLDGSMTTDHGVLVVSLSQYSLLRRTTY